jgi:hypothetical protein
MGTQGEAFLRSLLGADASTPAAPSPTTGGSGQAPPPSIVTPSQRVTETQTDIDTDAERAREAEQKRVADGPPSTFDQLAQWTTDATGGTGGGSGPGSYQFDPEAVSSLITKWEALYDEILKDGKDLAHARDSISPPSLDTPAGKQTDDARTSISAALSDNNQKAQYAQNYIDALRKANGTYVRQEDNAVGDLTKNNND